MCLFTLQRDNDIASHMKNQQKKTEINFPLRCHDPSLIPPSDPGLPDNPEK
jgi:hypothetical protein